MDADLAVALRYDFDGEELPRLVAKGRGVIAAQIVEIARAHGVTVEKDSDLAGILGALEVDSPIPVAAFAAVADILGQLYRTNRELREGRRR